MTAVALILAGYVLGCLTAGYYLVRLRTGADIRGIGSGSTGGRNVARVLGLPGFLAAGMLDAAKGALAVGVALRVPLGAWELALVMLAVVAGHIWPIQLGFRGGKGVAPFLGAMFAYDPAFVLITLAFIAAFYLISRRLTASGLTAIAISPLVPIALGRPPAEPLTVLALVLLVGFAHRSNVREEMDAVMARVG